MQSRPRAPQFYGPEETEDEEPTPPKIPTFDASQYEEQFDFDKLKVSSGAGVAGWVSSMSTFR